MRDSAQTPAPKQRPTANTIVSRSGQRGGTQSVYYRDAKGREPVNEWLERLGASSPRAVAKIDAFIDEHLNGRRAADPPTKSRITSHIGGGLRELRVRVGNTRYRILYQRSGNLIVLLHGFEKNTRVTPRDAIEIAQERFVKFKARMDAQPRVGPRAAGHDAPSRRGLER